MLQDHLTNVSESHAVRSKKINAKLVRCNANWAQLAASALDGLGHSPLMV